MGQLDQKVFLKTFGCQMNVSDSETILSSLVSEGFSETQEVRTADLIVINTCSIREKAEHKLRSMVGRLMKMKTLKPNVKIAIAGCMASRAGKSLIKELPGVAIIFGPDQVSLLPHLLKEHERTQKPVVKSNFEDEAVLFNPDHRTYQAKTSGFVSIMKGCEHKCTYCIVPLTRGVEKSRPLQSILNEVQFLVHEQGLREIMLVGQNVNGYGRDTAFDFPKLLWRLAQVPNLKRIRFMTSHPKDCSQDLADCFRDIPEISPYLHLPVQSGSNDVLRRMKRGHQHEQYRDRIDMLREAQPRIALSTDIIVGFPGETDRDFQDTLDLITSVEYDFAFSFIYSERPNTPATKLKDDVPLSEKKARLFELQKIIRELSYKKSMTLLGTTQEILITNLKREEDALVAVGHTDTYKLVKAVVPLDTQVQDLIQVKITNHHESRLFGESISPLGYTHTKGHLSYDTPQHPTAPLQ